jgi:hypothetical protein
VEQLSKAYDSERRDSSNVVRADLAQGWTRYAQDFPAPVQRDAERGIASWLVSKQPVQYAAA